VSEKYNAVKHPECVMYLGVSFKSAIGPAKKGKKKSPSVANQEGWNQLTGRTGSAERLICKKRKGGEKTRRA